MYVVTVLFQIERDAMERFLELTVENARTSLREERGCVVFDICPDPKAAEVFLYELYESRAGFDEHLASAHFRDFDRRVAQMIQEKTVRCYDEVIR